MKNIFIILSVVVHGVFPLDDNVFSKRNELSNMFCPVAVLDFGLQKTGTRCASLCSSSTTCKGFFYHKQDKICKGAEEMIFNTDGCQIMAGTNYYQNTEVTSTTSTTSTTTTATTTKAATTTAALTTTTATTTISSQYGKVCASESDCTMVNSKCLDGFCSCVAGYRYHSSTDMCIMYCLKYGSTYIEYRGMGLIAHTKINEYDNKDVTFCKDACSGELTCLGFNLGGSSNKCILEYGTPLTHASGFLERSDMSYFSRNCE
ncbi:uncharacterized protein LOC132733498 [Ruditapes philippinarum]|uniref:uncharacterized protein LOC132733498 n=1 Tax=Ruditapes philippinarum TaxID=129788 RepID=UPI00295B8285|nr:uncharacterized protein LOC132733498 [Ruditapes philippinarum]